MSTILLIETATDVCSVALSVHGEVIQEETLTSGKRHSAALTGMIQTITEALPQQLRSLSAVAISEGPGSYTGLRVGASVAKALCFSLEIPLISVSTLHALASPFRSHDHHVMSTIDARRQEAYAAIFVKGVQQSPVESIIFTPDKVQALALEFEQMIITGTGISKVAQLFEPYPHLIIKPSVCAASLLGPIAHEKYISRVFEDVAYYVPFYFKAPNITKPKKKLFE